MKIFLVMTLTGFGRVMLASQSELTLCPYYRGIERYAPTHAGITHAHTRTKHDKGSLMGSIREVQTNSIWKKKEAMGSQSIKAT